MSTSAARGGSRDAAQLEVGGGDHRAEVARRVDLGDDMDVAALREGDDVADVRLAEVVLRHDLRVGVRLDTEALVVGEVQPQFVVLQIARLPDPSSIQAAE